MSSERPGDHGIAADGPSHTSGSPSGPMASHLTLASSLGDPAIAAGSYGTDDRSRRLGGDRVAALHSVGP